MAVTNGKHEDFLATHLPQLVHNAVPEHLWQLLQEVRSQVLTASTCERSVSTIILYQYVGVAHMQKLDRQAFDAAKAFTFCYDALSQPKWTVICLEVRLCEYQLQLATPYAHPVPKQRMHDAGYCLQQRHLACGPRCDFWQRWGAGTRLGG